MKTKIFLSMIAIFCAVQFSTAQPPSKPKQEKVESMKIAYLTQRLDLSPEEAQVFWPVYNKFSDELETIRKSHRGNIKKAREDFDELSEKEIEKLVDSEIVFRQNELDVMKKYHPQFKQVLPIKKVAKLYRSEEDFKRKLLEMLQEKRDPQKDRPR